MASKHKRNVDNLSRLMNYVLGNRPDEFGLVPDQEGFIAIKELLKAIHEEPKMAYVRESHIREVLLHDRDAAFEISGNRIRCKIPNFSPVDRSEDTGPPAKILFKGVKRKAYPFVLKKGLFAGSGDHVVLATHRDLAIRIARRSDQNPVILEVRARAAYEEGIAFYPFGNTLYVADAVPAEFISGPPLPKEPLHKVEPPRKAKDFTPGSFIMEAERDPDLIRQKKTRKKIGWKEEVRKGRKRRRSSLDRDRGLSHIPL